MSLERGLGYLALASADDVPAYLRCLAPRGGGSLWITSRPDVARTDGGDVLWVSGLPRPGPTVDPKRLQEMRNAARVFLELHRGGLVILDCLDALVLHNGVERVVRSVEDLHDDVTTEGAILVVFLDPRGANPRLIAWLERELDGLPTEISRAVPPEGLLA